ncbi:hypothetical protein CBM2634_U70003 [Cupriavidus taiwanensis]|uniref:Uncharacterized protein n=1 Tax=Cupriavidus taiwanensis TaxID=164546 RepID=A0A375JEP8_9BURK|nr:hypothetical protein CBM2634_U70003 [Cupriavidus taiwanensis]
MDDRRSPLFRLLAFDRPNGHGNGLGIDRLDSVSLPDAVQACRIAYHQNHGASLWPLQGDGSGVGVRGNEVSRDGHFPAD